MLSLWNGPRIRLSCCLVVSLGLLTIAACGKSSTPVAEDEGPQLVPGEEFIDHEFCSPEEVKWLRAGKGFAVAIAQSDFAGAYKLLSSHAKATMSVNQFERPRHNLTQAKQNDANPLTNVGQDQFCDLVKKHIVDRGGRPHFVESLGVNTLDPQVLSRQGDKFDVAFAMGGTPDSLPNEIRRASLEAFIRTREEGEPTMTLEEARMEEGPYFKIMYILVEEAGETRVGYFEFKPPSMLD